MAAIYILIGFFLLVFFLACYLQLGCRRGGCFTGREKQNLYLDLD
jgi:hypothetical protein